MRRKFISLFLIMLLCINGTVFFTESKTASAKTSADFEDLKDLDAATKSKFDALIETGIFEGVQEGKFGLNDKMNRAQFAKVAALIFDLDVDTSSDTTSFTDVQQNYWAAHYIEAVKAAGITDGVGGGKYDPAGEVTKEQLATFLVRGLGWEKEAQATPGVSDKTVSDWAKGYVALAIEKKILTSGDNGEFGGTSAATRSQLVLASYEADKQYVPAKAKTASIISFQAIGSKTLVMKLDNSVDTSRAILSLTVPKESSNNWSLVWNDDKQATFTFKESMIEGNYVIHLSGFEESEVTATVTVEAEKITKIELDSSSDTISISKSVKIPFKLFNQYGQVVTNQPWLQVDVNTAVPAYIDTNSMAVIADTSSKAKGQQFSIQVLEQNSRVSAMKVFKVGDPEILQPEILEPVIITPTPSAAARPTANVGSGAVDSGTQVSLNAAQGAKIYFTTDGSSPSISSTLYTAPISITGAVTIKAIAVKSGMTNSSVLTLNYMIKPQAVIPTASVDSGAVDSGTQVSLSSTDGASIYYTMDGSMPNTSSTLYESPITISSATTIKAIAVKSGMTNSNVLALSYTIKPQAVIPTANVGSGAVNFGTQVSLSSSDGASIYYTMDGSTPDTSSTLYEAPISITQSVTIKAIAVKSGWTNSSVASFEYTIIIPIVLPGSIDSTLSSMVGQAYSGSVAASGGTGDITYSITSGQLPPGLDLDLSTGEITGTPTSSGTYSFTISATDSAATPVTASMQYIVTIAPATPTLTHLTSNPANVMLTAVGETKALSITASFNNNTSLDVTGEVQYESNNKRIATVSSTGVITAVASGTTNIVVTYGGLTETVTVTVIGSRQLESISVYLASNPLRVGETTNLIVFAYFDDGTAEDATAWATFEIKDPNLATIDANYILTALKLGSTKIEVTFLSEEETIDLEIILPRTD